MTVYGVGERLPISVVAVLLCLALAAFAFFRAPHRLPATEPVANANVPRADSTPNVSDAAAVRLAALASERGAAMASEESGSGGANRPKREVLVLGIEGAAVAGAECSTAPEWTVVATTSERGEVSSSDFVGSVEFVVRANGWVTRRLQLPGGERSQERVTIVLQRSGTIVGEIHSPLGGRVGAGVRVLVVPPTEPLNDAIIALALIGAGPLTAATSDDQGAFSIGGLELGTAYRLFAGGSGLIQLDPFQPPVFARPELDEPGTVEPFVVITMEYAYGVDLEFCDSEGGPLSTSPRMAGQWAGTPRPVDTRARVVPSDCAGRLVLGRPSATMNASFHRRWFVFAADLDLGDEIDLTLDVTIPGYLPAEQLITARRIEHEMPLRVVNLSRDRRSFGVVEVRLEPLDSISDIVVEAMYSVGAPVLHLTDVESGQRSTVELPGITRGFERIEGIPSGSYSAVFEAPGQLMRFPSANDPPRLLQVGALDAELEVPVASFGTIVLDPIAFDDNLHSGSIMVGLARLDPITGQEVESGVLLLRRRPYAIPFVPQGTYRVDFIAPEAATISEVKVEPQSAVHLACRF